MNKKAPGQKRTLSVDSRFTPAEAAQLKKLCEREDRTAGNAVHWIVRRYLAGELVEIKPASA